MKRSMLAAALVCLAAADPRTQTTSPFISELEAVLLRGCEAEPDAMVERMPEDVSLQARPRDSFVGD